MRKPPTRRQALRALGNIRFLGPDIHPFRMDVKLVNDYIVWLEEEARALRRALVELQEHAGEGE